MAEGAVRIEPAAAHRDDWVRLREALWPGCSAAEHQAEADRWLRRADAHGAFVALRGREVQGLVECAVRTDHVNGCDHAPAGFIEGLYVVPASRGCGLARRLVDTAASWARARGCRELASDVLLANDASQAVHRALGFVETERVIYFKREL
jgi:aminoglycoside 6'-N-acetyltransferase I